MKKNIWKAVKYMKKMISQLKVRIIYNNKIRNIIDEKYPYTAMYLMINGMIESGKIPDEDGISIKFDIIHGYQWELHSGNSTGISQHAYKSMQTNDKVVWNFPFEQIYRMNDVSGWPKICVTLTSRDFFGRDIICGYGIIHVPT